jgi:hypothetical protein
LARSGAVPSSFMPYSRAESAYTAFTGNVQRASAAAGPSRPSTRLFAGPQQQNSWNELIFGLFGLTLTKVGRLVTLVRLPAPTGAFTPDGVPRFVPSSAVTRCRPAALPRAGDRPTAHSPVGPARCPGWASPPHPGPARRHREQRTDLVDRANAIRPRIVR